MRFKQLSFQPLELLQLVVVLALLKERPALRLLNRADNDLFVLNR